MKAARMRQVRVLQVVTGSDWGGAQQHVLWLAQGLRERGFAVSVACQPGGYLVDRLKQARIAVWLLPNMARSINPYRDWRTYQDLRRVLGEGEYDLVHAHSSKAGALTRLAAASRGIPAIFTAHGLVFSNVAMAPWKRRVYAGAERILGRRTSHLITVSRADAEAARKNRLVPDGRLTVVPNGVPVPDPGQLPWLRSEGRRSLGLDPEAPVVGVIARLHPDKDLSTWLRAAALVRESTPGVRFVVIGDGPERGSLRRLAQDLGLDPVLLWAGEQPDASRLLPSFDVFALSSVKEGLPLTLLEAMAHGVPAASTTVGGVPEVIDEGRTGLLVPPRNPDALAEAILRLLASGLPSGVDGVGGRALDHVRQTFSIDAMVDRTAAIYRQVLQERDSTRGEA